jgi:hypothetical protein
MPTGISRTSQGIHSNTEDKFRAQQFDIRCTTHPCAEWCERNSYCEGVRRKQDKKRGILADVSRQLI